MDWVDQAVCRSIDPELWFPEKGGSTHAARRVCVTCPVQRQCLKYSFDIRAEFGIWGGMPASHREKAQESYIKRTKRDRDRMIDNLLNKIDEDVEAGLEGIAATKERDSERKKRWRRGKAA